MGFSWGVLFSDLIKWYWTNFDITHVAWVWHIPDIVCDNSFGTVEAQSACYTLGYTNGGAFDTYYNSYDYDYYTLWSESEIPILMDDVECQSVSTIFSSCSSNDDHDCAHYENVILTCFESG